ncbi:hypothetical protein D3C76_1316710 [compost metagenome]
MSGKMQRDIPCLIPRHPKPVLLLYNLSEAEGNDEHIGILAVNILHQWVAELKIVIQPVQQREHMQ